MKITCRVEFDAGHRLLNYKWRCRHLHGHRYVVEMTVESFQLDETGFVADFGEIEGVLKDWIDTYWDHGLILHELDPVHPAIRSVLTDQRVYVMSKNPTAENMAIVLWDAMQMNLPNKINLTRIRLYETPDSWADYEGNQE